MMKKTVVAGAIAMFAVPLTALPAQAAEVTTAPDTFDVVCVQVTDGNGHPVGPKVCVPWLLPVPPPAPAA